MTRSPLYRCIYEVVQRIPPGKVATYGQVAALAGYPGYARQVGYALHATPPGMDLPWHRVVNAKGMVSLKSDGPYDDIQRQMLESEGVVFNEKDRIPLKVYQWVTES